MKTLADCTPVPARTYYYLLDYMDRRFDVKPLVKLCGKERLCDVNISEYLKLFRLATEDDITLLSNKL